MLRNYFLLCSIVLAIPLLHASFNEIPVASIAMGFYVQDIAYSQDGSHFATMEIKDSDKVRLYKTRPNLFLDLSTEQDLIPLMPTWSTCFSGRTKQLAVAGTNALYLYDLNDTYTPEKPNRFDVDTTKVSVSSDGLYLAYTSYRDKLARIYVLSSLPKKPLLVYSIDNLTGPYGITFYGEDDYLAIADRDARAIKLYRLTESQGAQLIQTLEGFEHPYTIRCTPDGKFLAIGDIAQAKVLFHKIQEDFRVESTPTLTIENVTPYGFDFSPDGTTLAIAANTKINFYVPKPQIKLNTGGIRVDQKTLPIEQTSAIQQTALISAIYEKYCSN